LGGIGDPNAIAYAKKNFKKLQKGELIDADMRLMILEVFVENTGKYLKLF